MSFKFTALALDHGPSDALSKLVLMALCDRADQNGVCWPSRKDLMARCNIGRTCLTNKLRALEAAQWIQRKQRFQSSSVFRINVQRLVRLEAEANDVRSVAPPAGFVPFDDEKRPAQVIENKDDAASRSHDAASRSHDAAKRCTNLSKNQSKKRGPSVQKCADPAKRDPDARPMGGGSGVAASEKAGRSSDPWARAAAAAGAGLKWVHPDNGQWMLPDQFQKIAEKVQVHHG